MTRLCVFCKCGAPQVQITKEHVLRSWLRQLGRPDSKLFWQQAYLDPASGLPCSSSLEIPISPYDMQIADVCESCNGNWLNRLIEEPVGDIIVSMAKGRSVEIDVVGATRLATWAAKTAIVRALIDKGKRVIPDSHYSWIKEKLLPPPNTSIWVGRCHPPYDTWTRHKRFIIGAGVAKRG